MIMGENKAFKIAGIRNLMTRNYRLSRDELDLEALVDDTLSMSENWNNTVKPLVFDIDMLPSDFKYYLMGACCYGE